MTQTITLNGNAVNAESLNSHMIEAINNEGYDIFNLNSYFFNAAIEGRECEIEVGSACDNNGCIEFVEVNVNSSTGNESDEAYITSMIDYNAIYGAVEALYNEAYDEDYQPTRAQRREVKRYMNALKG